MPELDLESLAALGLNPTLAARALPLLNETDADATASSRIARVVEVHREAVVIDDGRRQHASRAMPRLLRALQDDGDALAVVIG